MICIVAFIVLGFLSIFSATYRPLFKEALNCVLKRITLKKCDSSLDERIKSKITGKLMKKSPKLALFVFKRFEILSWIFTVVLAISMVYSGIGVYNYVKYGHCQGPTDEGFCVLHALEGETHTHFENINEDNIVLPDIDDDPMYGNENAEVTVIEFGCYLCPYTREAEENMIRLRNEYKDRIRFVYRDFPIEQKHVNAFMHSEAANCALEQGKFWEYHKRLFDEQEVCSVSNDHKEMLIGFAEEIGLDENKFANCLESGRYREEIENDINDGINAGLKGTPTVFINGKSLTGPRPYDAYKKLVEDELKK